jgi:hypothetical protein
MKAFALRQNAKRRGLYLYESDKTIVHRSNAGGPYGWLMGSDRDYVRG